MAEGEEALAAVTDPGDEQRILAFVTLIRICRGDPTDAATRAHRGAAPGDQRPG